MTGRVRLGELLVDGRIISREQLDEVLAQQRTDGRRLGTLLVESGLVNETQVTQILSQQLSVPWVSLYHIDFSRQLLNLVSQELAEQYCLVPIFVRRVRGLGETLYVAMDDPSDESAQRAVSEWAGLPVRTMIAPPSDIRSAIKVYYGAGTDAPSLAEAEAAISMAAQDPSRSTIPTRKAHSEVLSALQNELVDPEADTALSPGTALRVQEEVLEPESGLPIQAREVTMPAPVQGGSTKMVTLTLLDGTQINLPATRAMGRETAELEPGQLTARDLVAALRAVSHGADGSEILGRDVRWEKLFAALLSLLLKKHLIADWEFVDEYKKN